MPTPLQPLPAAQQHVQGMERYQGEFKDDKRHGRGTCIFPDGSRYTGEWHSGLLSGDGRFEHTNGDVFVGTLANKRRVRGKLTWSSGDTYDGDFGADDEPSGEGSLHLVLENVVHTGKFLNGQPHGQGERRELGSGEVRRGEFDGDELHGEGEETLPGGLAHRMGAERYTGQFERGVRTGRGRLQTCGLGEAAWAEDAWTRSWAGTWENGEPASDCEELIERSASGGASGSGGGSSGSGGGSGGGGSSSDGSGWAEVHYSGGWKHGTRHGFGKQTEPGGATYEGEWHRGHMEGRGTHHDPSTRESYTGEFLAGRRHGHGEVARPGGWRFVGKFEVGAQRGEGTLTFGARRSDEAHAAADGRGGDGSGDGSDDVDVGGDGAGDTVHGAGFLDFELHGPGLRTYANGDSYEGELAGPAMLPNGRGTRLYADGGSLEGHFADGEAEGEARLTSAAGDVYEGPVRRSLPSGYGTWVGSNGARFEGEFERGARHGSGRLIQADGATIDGHWRNGLLDGRAEVVSADGARYAGDFVAGKRDGHGMARRADGSMYDGQWRANEPHGEGAWIAPASVAVGRPAAAPGAAVPGAETDGSTGAAFEFDPPTKYNGSWVEGKRTGHGSIVYASGASYVGTLDEEESFDGAGRYTAAEGSALGFSYDGQWMRGVRHGAGKSTDYADGSCYDGEWVAGRRHGVGRLENASGDVWEGGFEADALVGRGKLVYVDGRTFVGTVVVTDDAPEGGVPHGFGTMVEFDGETYEGEFVMGDRDGAGKLTHTNGDVFEGTFKRGMRHGPGVQRTRGGTTYEGEWVDDALEGQVVVVEGALLAAHQQDGRVMGTVRSDGQLSLAHTFANGDVYTGGWDHGGPHGEGTMEFSSGSKYEGGWELGLPHGLGAYTFRSGDRYFGSWVGGIPHGTGRMEYAAGGVYDGGWEAPGEDGSGGSGSSSPLGKLAPQHGERGFSSADVILLEQQRQKQQREKQQQGKERGATRSLPHHDIEPLARRSQFHGDGRLKSSGGETYEGQWRHGARHGKGRSSHPAGEWCARTCRRIHARAEHALSVSLAWPKPCIHQRAVFRLYLTPFPPSLSAPVAYPGTQVRRRVGQRPPPRPRQGAAALG